MIDVCREVMQMRNGRWLALETVRDGEDLRIRVCRIYETKERACAALNINPFELEETDG